MDWVRVGFSESVRKERVERDEERDKNGLVKRDILGK